MKGLILSAILLISILSASSQSVGLVLSGGGAKGIAHIGVIQALEENNIPIDYISGTSIGSIVGGLYASGYTPNEMMDLVRSKGFSYWSTGQMDENLLYYFTKPSPSPSIINLNLRLSDSIKITTNIIPKSLINPLPMNFAFMELFSAYTAQCGGNFNNLFVPFRCVASDVYNKHKIICSSGSLGDAIRASMSFPIVFKPIKLNGVFAFDGGIYDNFPVDVMRHDFAPSMIIGIDVSSGASNPEKDNLVDQIEAMVMQPQNDTIAADEGMKISINVQQFGLLDFPQAQAIYKIGYDKTMSMMDSIKARIARRVPAETVQLKRNVFKSQTPEIVFDTVSVSGANNEQNDYIKYLFEKDNQKDTLSLEEAKIAYYRAISSGKIDDLLPQAKYEPKKKMFNLGLNVKVADKFGVGVGGYISSSTNSMIYLSARYKTLSFNSFDASINGWMGQSYYAGELNAKIALLTDVPSDIHLQGVMSRQRFYESDILFYSDELPTFILNYDNYVRIKYGLAIGRKAKFEVGLGYGFLRDKFYPSNLVDYSQTDQDEANYKLGQLYASIGTSTLNALNYPTSGFSLQATIMGIYGKNKFMLQGVEESLYKNCAWAQIEVEASKYWQLSKKFVLGGKVDVIASSKKLFDNYTASLVQAPAFMPTPATQNYFNPAFRSNSFAAAGILPIWKIVENLQLRSEFYAFMPLRKIEDNGSGDPYYSKMIDFGNLSYIAEASLVYSFPFASISLYGNYLSYPAKNWNFGISFGLLIPAQKFLR